MTAPAPHGALSTDPRVLPGYQGDDDLHPDVRAYAAELVGPVTPYRLKWLQRQYDRGLLQRAQREQETPVLTRVLGRRGSVPVDARVGERVAGRAA